LKEGHQSFEGLDEAVGKNIEAARALAEITRTSIGPNGMSKMVINHLEKLFVTSDASTITEELEVVHPAAKLLALAARAQEQEVGDGTNLVVTLAGELLKQAEPLLRDGISPADILTGFNLARDYACGVMDELVTEEVKDVTDKAKVTRVLKSVLASKQWGLEDVLAPLVAEACLAVCPKNAANFAVDSVRTAKIIGSSVGASEMVRGLVVRRGVEGTVKHLKNVRVAIYQNGIDLADTDTSGTVLIKNAEELTDLANSEERRMGGMVKELADAGITCVVAGSTVSELASHFFERHGIMVIKVISKFEQRRICKVTGAAQLAKFVLPSPAEIGVCSSVSEDEVGGSKVTVFTQNAEDAATGVATVVLRASTENILDDIERAVDDAINVFRATCKDGRFVPGAAACELEMSRRLKAHARTLPGLEQYAVEAFAKALDVLPTTMAENAGWDGTEALSALYKAHAEGAVGAGVDVEEGCVMDAVARGVLDHVGVKWWALKHATDAAVTVLRVDQIIMSKQASSKAAAERANQPALGGR